MKAPFLPITRENIAVNGGKALFLSINRKIYAANGMKAPPLYITQEKIRRKWKECDSFALTVVYLPAHLDSTASI